MFTPQLRRPEWLGLLYTLDEKAPLRPVVLWALLGCLVVFGLQWAVLGQSPLLRSELIYSGNVATSRIVLKTWQEMASPVSVAALQGANALDLAFVVCYGILFLAGIGKAGISYADGAKSWKMRVRNLLFLALAFHLIQILTFFSLPALLFSSDEAARCAVSLLFIAATARAFLDWLVIVYSIAGWAQSPWTRGAWEATRACGFSVFAALVAPALLKFGNQGAAIFDATDQHGDRLRWALAGTLFFSFMCWYAARYAVSYKDKEAEALPLQPGKEQATPPPQPRGGRAEIMRLVSDTLALPRTDESTSETASQTQQKAAEGNFLNFKAQQAPDDPPQISADKYQFDFDKGWADATVWVPRVCGLFPSVFIGLIILTADAKDLSHKGAGWWMFSITLAMSVFLAARACYLYQAQGLTWQGIRTYFRTLFQSQTPDPNHAAKQKYWDQVIYRSASVIFGLLVLGTCASPAALRHVVTRWEIGPLAAWFFSFSLAVPFFTWLVWTGRRRNKPFLAMFLLYGFLCNAANLNDDHGLRHRYLPAPTQKPMELNPAFDQWLVSVGAKQWSEKHGNAPYPVVFVAAAGGGIVAGSVLTSRLD